MEDKTERMPNASETEAIPRSHESDGEATEAEKGMDTNQNGESSPEGFSDPSFSNKRRKFIPIIAGAAAVLLIAGGTAFALNQPPAADQAPQAVEEVAPAADSDEPVKETYRIHSANGAAGLDPETEADYYGGTPIIVHIKGTSDEVKDVDFYKAVERDSKAQEFELVKGDYDVTYIDSITPRGGIASMAKSSSPTGWFGNSKNYGNYSHAVTIAPGYIAPEDVTQEQIDEIMDQLKDAVAKGDETLAGEKGQAVIDAATKNAASVKGEEESLTQVSAAPVNEEATVQASPSASGSPSSVPTSQAQAPTQTHEPAPAPDPQPQPEPAPAPEPAPTPQPEPEPAPMPQPTPIYGYLFGNGHIEYDGDAADMYSAQNSIGYTYTVVGYK